MLDILVVDALCVIRIYFALVRHKTRMGVCKQFPTLPVRRKTSRELTEIKHTSHVL